MGYYTTIIFLACASMIVMMVQLKKHIFLRAVCATDFMRLLS